MHFFTAHTLSTMFIHHSLLYVVRNKLDKEAKKSLVLFPNGKHKQHRHIIFVITYVLLFPYLPESLSDTEKPFPKVPFYTEQ